MQVNMMSDSDGKSIISRKLLDSLPELLQLVTASSKLPTPIEVCSEPVEAVPLPLPCSESASTADSSLSVLPSYLDVSGSGHGAKNWQRPELAEVSLKASKQSQTGTYQPNAVEGAPPAPCDGALLGKRKADSSELSSPSPEIVSVFPLVSNTGSSGFRLPPALETFLNTSVSAAATLSQLTAVMPPRCQNAANNVVGSPDRMLKSSKPDENVNKDATTSKSLNKGTGKKIKRKTNDLQRTLGLINSIIGPTVCNNVPAASTTVVESADPGPSKISTTVVESADPGPSKIPAIVGLRNRKSWPSCPPADSRAAQAEPRAEQESESERGARRRSGVEPGDPHRDSSSSVDSPDEERGRVRKLLLENRKLEKELQSYVAHDRALLRREQRQLDEYRRIVREERALRYKAETAAAEAKSKAAKLKQQLKAQTAAHDEEVNGLYELLLADKQQILTYCEQVNQLNVQLAELQQTQLKASAQSLAQVKEELSLKVEPKVEPAEYVEYVEEAP